MLEDVVCHEIRFLALRVRFVRWILCKRDSESYDLCEARSKVLRMVSFLGDWGMLYHVKSPAEIMYYAGYKRSKYTSLKGKPLDHLRLIRDEKGGN